MKLIVRLVLAGLCLALAVSAHAQGGGATTSLSGTVTDTSGAVIPGASVAVKNTATSTPFETVTNESGYFTVPALDPGTYSVTVTLMGFKTAVLNDVRLNASTPATVKVALEVGGLTDTVVVEGGAEIIQTTSAAVTSTIDTEQILKVPVGSRSALEFVTLLPGVNTPDGPGGSRDSSINGLPQSAINITIDGMSAQDNHLKTGDGFFARVSPRLDAIEEVTVNAAAQDAASTGQGAVQIRFVTRSGSNNFNGSGYYYLRHYKLDANTWFNNRDGAPKGEDVLHQPGARVGGPIWRNKAFFFVNYEESRSPGGTHREPHDPAPALRRRLVPLYGQRRDPRDQRPLARRGGWSGRQHRPDGQPPARRHPQLDRRQHGHGQHEPADPEFHLLVRDRQRHEVSDRPHRLQRHRQAPAVVVDDLHGSGVDAGHDQQPRAELPRLPQHRQPGLGSLHHPRHPALDARQHGQRVHRRRLRRPDQVLAGDCGEPVQRHLARRSGGFPPQHQRCRRHHQRGVDRFLLGA